MLDTYLTLTNALLQNPSATNNLYSQTLITQYINQARDWVAGDSQSIKALGTYSVTVGSQGPYPFSGITLTTSTGIEGVLNVRQQWYEVGTGQLWFRGRSWPWFSVYEFNTAAPRQSVPKTWAQYGEGESGTIYISPQPDQAYVIQADCICIPIDLVDDSTVEVLPAPWTIAVPYYAAYLALLSAQTGARVQDAGRMLQLYQQFAAGARAQATPDVMPTNYPQQKSPVRDNQLGVKGGANG